MTDIIIWLRCLIAQGGLRLVRSGRSDADSVGGIAAPADAASDAARPRSIRTILAALAFRGKAQVAIQTTALRVMMRASSTKPRCKPLTAADDASTCAQRLCVASHFRKI